VQWLSIVAVIFSTVAGITSSYFIFQNTKSAQQDRLAIDDRTTKLEERKVDRDEMDRALSWRDREIKMLRDDNEAARKRERSYVKFIRQLIQILREHEINVPDPPEDLIL
jgi:hypothetical protein